MKLKTLITLAVAGAFAVPLVAQASADGDRMILASGGPAGASAQGSGGATGGVASPQTTGEPRLAPGPGAAERGATSGTAGATSGMAPSFEMLDANKDGQISRAEWDAHMKADAASGSSGMGASGGATTGSSTTGAKAGAGSAAGTTGTGSATATTPDTSGQGTPK
jgi:hypothetical protein